MRYSSRVAVYLSAFVLGVVSSVAHASTSGVTYQGRIMKPDGSPLSGEFTQFKMQIRTPDSGSCLMYEEVQTQDLRSTNGMFSLTMNDTSGTRTDTTGLALDRIFANRGSFTLNAASCISGPGTFTPAASDGRDLVVLFKDETMASWEPIPPQKINFVPYAFESKQIAGFTADSLLRIVNGSGDPLTGIAPLSNAQYTALMDLANGSSAVYSKAGELNGAALPTMTTGEVLGWNGTTWVSMSSIPNSSVTGAKLDPAISILTSGTVASAITTTRDFKIYAASPSTFYVGMAAPALAASYTLTWPLTAGTSNQVLTTDGSGNLTWTTPAGTGISALTGDVTATGTGSVAATVASVGGSTAALVHSAELEANAATSANTISTIVKRDASGAFVTSSAKFTSSMILKDGAAGGEVSIATPTAFTSYTLTLPTTDGNNGEVLTTNGTGALSWNVLPAASQWTTQAPGINYMGGNVGIGTTSPEALLGVNGTVSVKASTEGVATYVNTGASYAIPDTSMNIRRLTLDADTTITLPAFTLSASRMYNITLFLKQDATGGRTITWAGNGADTIRWDSGAPPSISMTPDKITVVQLMKASDESFWYGSMTWREN